MARPRARSATERHAPSSTTPDCGPHDPSDGIPPVKYILGHRHERPDLDGSRASEDGGAGTDLGEQTPSQRIPREVAPMTPSGSRGELAETKKPRQFTQWDWRGLS